MNHIGSTDILVLTPFQMLFKGSNLGALIASGKITKKKKDINGVSTSKIPLFYVCHAGIRSSGDIFQFLLLSFFAPKIVRTNGDFHVLQILKNP